MTWWTEWILLLHNNSISHDIQSTNEGMDKTKVVVISFTSSTIPFPWDPLVIYFPYLEWIHKVREGMDLNEDLIWEDVCYRVA